MGYRIAFVMSLFIQQKRVQKRVQVTTKKSIKHYNLNQIENIYNTLINSAETFFIFLYAINLIICVKATLNFALWTGLMAENGHFTRNFFFGFCPGLKSE